MADRAFPLALAAEGECVRIARFGASHALGLRLTELGLNVGCELRVAQSDGAQMVVIRGETRLALGVGLSHRIFVVPVTQSDGLRRDE